MDSIILLLIGFAAGYWYGRQAGAADPKVEKVKALFTDGAEVFNDQVQSALGVSDSTATRYLDELEKEGYIVQHGSTGRGVVYKKK